MTGFSSAGVLRPSRPSAWVRARYPFTVLHRIARFPAALPALTAGRFAAAERLRQLTRAAFLRHPTEWADVPEGRVAIDPRDSGIAPELAIHGSYEPGTAALMRGILQPGQTVVDAGAHVGFLTLVAASAVGPSGRVIAVEPNPETSRLLERTVAANRLANVTVVVAALGPIDGRAALFRNPGSDTMLHSTLPHEGWPTVEVAMRSLDRLVEELGLPSIDLLKLDVEGAEPAAMHGALQSLETGRVRSILMEWRPEVWSGEGAVLLELKARFDLFRVGGVALRLVRRLPDVPSEFAGALWWAERERYTR
jgi:FkbM family methyltransferase